MCRNVTIKCWSAIAAADLALIRLAVLSTPLFAQAQLATLRGNTSCHRWPCVEIQTRTMPGLHLPQLRKHC